MAADRQKSTLMISLIIFVMISFILAVTTYLGFQQKAKERQAAATARGEMERANRERDAAVESLTRVRAALGSDKEAADAVEAERTELFDSRFPGFDKEPKSYSKLVEWLDEAVKRKDEQLAKLAAEMNEKIREQTEKATQAEAARAAAEQARDAAIKEQADEKAKFTEDRKRHEQTLGELRAKQDEALAQAEQLKAITDELAKLGPLLAPEARRKFGAAPPQGQPVPWPERVRSVNAELRARDEALKDINATLARLRVADPQLQALVRDATPPDDRIDGFDGRIATVNSLDQTVLIVCDSTAGMRPGLALSVYPPGDLRPPAGARKGLVEVVQVEGPTLARARILQDLPTDPILTNDGVATSLWAPGAVQEIAIVGYERFAAGRRRADAADRPEAGGPRPDPLLALVERNGAKIVDTVTPQTALVVDTGAPDDDELTTDGDRRDWKTADLVRQRAIARAGELGIRVVSVDGLLDLLGLDREVLDGRRLPWETGAAP